VQIRKGEVSRRLGASRESLEGEALNYIKVPKACALLPADLLFMLPSQTTTQEVMKYRGSDNRCGEERQWTLGFNTFPVELDPTTAMSILKKREQARTLLR